MVFSAKENACEKYSREQCQCVGPYLELRFPDQCQRKEHFLVSDPTSTQKINDSFCENSRQIEM